MRHFLVVLIEGDIRPAVRPPGRQVSRQEDVARPKARHRDHQQKRRHNRRQTPPGLERKHRATGARNRHHRQQLEEVPWGETQAETHAG